MALDKIMLIQDIKDLSNITANGGALSNDTLANDLASAIESYVPQEGAHFKGLFIDITALVLGVTTPVVGDYAYVDAGAGEDIVSYLWDTQEGWIGQVGGVGAETPSSVKTKYETNADTNAFTDNEKAEVSANTAKVSNIVQTSVTGNAGTVTNGVYTADSRLSDNRNANLAGNLLKAVPANALFTDTIYDDTLLQVDVNTNTASRHSHNNKATLDKFGENVGGLPTYNNISIDTTIAQRDVYDGLDSIDNTVSLSAKQGKVLKDVQDTQQTAINLNTAKVIPTDFDPAGTDNSDNNAVNTLYSGLVSNTVTNLTKLVTGTTVTIESSDGTDVIIDTATSSNAGVISAEDKLKLIGIEELATADQSNVEIKTAYEGNVNTNAFTDISVNTLSSALQPADKGTSNGVASLDSVGLIPISQLPVDVYDVLVYNTLGELPTTGDSNKIYLVLDRLRGAIAPYPELEFGGNLMEFGGDLAEFGGSYAIEVNSLYCWSGTAYSLLNPVVSPKEVKASYETNADTNAFTDSEKAEVSANTIKVGITSQQASEITANTVDRHSHTNKTTLDKFGENVGGLPTYNGVQVDTTIAQRDVYDALDSIDNTVSLSAKQGKILKDVQDTQQTAINSNTAKVSNIVQPADALVAQDITDIQNLSGTNTGDNAPNTLYSGLVNYTLPASVVHDNEKLALHATDALRLSGNNISLYKGDGSSETVALPITTNVTATVGISLQGNNTNNPVVLKSTGIISAVRTSVGKYQVDVNGSLDGYLSTGTSFTGIVKVIKGSPILIETYNSALLGELYDMQSDDVLDISIRV